MNSEVKSVPGAEFLSDGGREADGVYRSDPANRVSPEAGWTLRGAGMPSSRDSFHVGSEAVWFVFRRHIWLFVSVVIAAMVLIAAVLSVMEPRYSTQATVVLQLPDVLTDPTGEQAQSVVLNRSIVETQLDVLRSRAFATRVAEKLSLFDDPRFIPPDKPNEPMSEVERRQRVVDLLLDSYSVSRSGESLAIDIVSRSADAQLAADVANTVASTLISDIFGNRVAKTDRAIVAAQERVAALADELTQSEIELAAYILEHNLNDPRLLDNLKAQIDYLSRLLDETFADQPNSVEARRVSAELADTKAALHAQTQAELTRLRLDKGLELLRVRSDDAVERLNKLETQRRFLEEGARQISVARVPPDPAWPNWPTALAVGGVASFVLAFVLALILEGNDRRIRSDLEVSRGFGLVNAGFLPRIAIPPGGLSASHVLQYLKNEPHSVFSESARGIVTTMLGVEHERHVIMVASGLPGEGASLVTCALAGSASLVGLKVLLVRIGESGDAASFAGGKDLRAGHVTELPWHRSEPLPAPLAVNGEPFPGLSILHLDKHAPLGGREQRLRLSDLKEKLRIEFDLVLVDAPAILHSDAAVRFCPLVDGVLGVVRWGQTTEDELNDSLARLETEGVRVSATVINDVDFQRHQRLGFGGRAQYLADA